MKNINTIAATKSPQLIQRKVSNDPKVMTFEELYLKKDFKGAAQYLLQNKQQFSSGIFHYNLGTVYAKLIDYPAARFHFEKAIKDGYINSASLNNLGYVKSVIEVDDISTSTSIQDQLINTSLSIPSAAYLSASLIFLLITLLLIKTKNVTKKMTIFILAIFIFSPICYSHFYLENINYAVAFKDVPIYEGPSKIFTEKGKLRAGSKIILGEFKDGWFSIKFPISLAGWVNKDQLGLY
jgi:tetratricopeptide (TPR) repeat protein